jgi:hypothetical protein
MKGGPCAVVSLVVAKPMTASVVCLLKVTQNQNSLLLSSLIFCVVVVLRRNSR